MDTISLILTIIGAVNWGLVGLFSFDLVAAICGSGSVVSRIVYVLVALGGIWCLTILPRLFRRGGERRE